MTSHPNVVWILCDELRTDALSCYGGAHPSIATPNIDRLASEGVVFDRAYTTSPVCVPARTSLLTGLAPNRTGVYGNEAYAPDYPLDPVPSTFPEALAENGWSTSDFGKEHVPRSMQPWQQQDPEGSDMSELTRRATNGGAALLKTPGMGFIVGGTWPEELPYPPSSVTRNVLNAIEQSGDVPFLIRASYLQPHTPVIVPEPWASRYSAADFSPPTERSESQSSGFESRFAEVNNGDRMGATEMGRARAYYYGAVSWVDDQVGLILECLHERGLRGDTIVMLTADHGAYLGEHGAFGKHTFAPQCHQIPLIFSWSDRLLPGSRRSDLAHGVDMARTVAGLCGIKMSDLFEGRDLFEEAAPEAIVSSIGYGARESRAFPNLNAGTLADGVGWPQRFCARTLRYRLDMTTRVNGHEASLEERDIFLADSYDDPEELHNLAGESALEAVEQQLTELIVRLAHESAQPSDDAVYGGFPTRDPLVGR